VLAIFLQIQTQKNGTGSLSTQSVFASCQYSLEPVLRARCTLVSLIAHRSWSLDPQHVSQGHACRSESGSLIRGLLAPSAESTECSQILVLIRSMCPKATWWKREQRIDKVLPASRAAGRAALISHSGLCL
jgi:hypothetical protein